MKRVWIIARREFLSYVATWGFWLSLGMVPVFMTVGFGLPALLSQSTPQRVYTIVADDPAIVQAVDAAFAQRRAGEAGETLAALAGARNGPDSANAVRDALDRGASPAEAAREAGLPEAMVAQAEAGVRRRYVRIDPPARTEAGLRPYLTGEQRAPGAEGRGPLHAAIFVRRGADGRYAIDYWSANVTNPELRSAVADAVAGVMRDDALRAAGVDPARVREVASARPVVRELSPDKAEGEAEVTLSDRLPFIFGIGAGFVLWSVIFSVANMLLTSTIEEKSNKVLEVLLSSARLPEILAGKLLGVAGVSFALLAVWLGGGAAVLTFIATASPQPGPAAEIMRAMADPAMLAPFLFYFVVGYLIYGAVFMAIGSLCETMQEAQTLMSPIILILMAPVILLGFSISNMDSPFIGAAAWVPVFTPFLMMARLPHDPPLWEILGTSALMLVTLVFAIWLGSRVFRAGALGQAKPGSLMKALRAPV